MENDSSVLSTASLDLEDDDFLTDPTTILWRWVWPLICVSGLVGNTLVLLVLMRDGGLVGTSANVYLTALAAGDSFVLMVASVKVYPGLAWGFWVEDTSIWTCRAIWLLYKTLLSASIWFMVAFTAERCVAIRYPLLKLRLCTPNKAGLCCVALLVVAFVKTSIYFSYSTLQPTLWATSLATSRCTTKLMLYTTEHGLASSLPPPGRYLLFSSVTGLS